MKTKKDYERRKRRRKTERRVRTATFLMVLMLLGSGVGVYAKYFTDSARWGIAIASKIYFTANYAAETANADAQVEDDFFEWIVKSDYVGGDADIVFEVRNYENNLLFNESTVIIPYSLSFWLGEEVQDGTTYQLICDDTVQGVLDTEKFTISGRSIAGGGAKSDKYTIKLMVPENTTHTAVPIYVEVNTDAGAVVDKTLRGKMSLNNAATQALNIQYKGFVIPGVDESDNGLSDEEKFAKLNELSAFTYEVRTVGELTDNVTEQLKLSWNSKLLEIDLFDDAYLAWKAKEENKNKIQPDAEEIDGNIWYYIIMDVMPYSSQTVNFLRVDGDENGDLMNDILDLGTMAAFEEAAIKAEIYKTAAEEGE